MSTENDRLNALRSYHILDTPAEQELNDLTEIASGILETPIALISLVDDKRQWFKANKGLNTNSTPREISFCQHVLTTPDDVLVVEDTQINELFKDNPLVTGDPNIRFYAGAPLVTPKGFVLGTLCIIDNKPRKISDTQKKALKLLAQKTMDILEVKRLLKEQQITLEQNLEKVKQLSYHNTGATFQLEANADGFFTLNFVSDGILKMFPNLDIDGLSENPSLLLDHIYPEYHNLILKSIYRSYKTQKAFYIKVKSYLPNQRKSWLLFKGKPQKVSNGNIIWYGVIGDITMQHLQSDTLNQVVFDISHVIRKPFSSLQSILQLMQSQHIQINPSLREYLCLMEIACDEIDDSLRELNETYSLRLNEIQIV